MIKFNILEKEGLTDAQIGQVEEQGYIEEIEELRRYIKTLKQEIKVDEILVHQLKEENHNLNEALAVEQSLRTDLEVKNNE